jgi:hypothetical protein
VSNEKSLLAQALFQYSVFPEYVTQTYIRTSAASEFSERLRPAGKVHIAMRASAEQTVVTQFRSLGIAEPPERICHSCIVQMIIVPEKSGYR